MVNKNKLNIVYHLIQLIYHLNLIVYIDYDMYNYLILFVDILYLIYMGWDGMDNHDIH